MRTAVVLSTIFLVTACGDVVNERTSTVTVRGATFPVVTQTINNGGRTYDVSRVSVNNTTRLCDLQLTGDCESAVRTELDNPGGPG